MRRLDQEKALLVGFDGRLPWRLVLMPASASAAEPPVTGLRDSPVILFAAMSGSTPARKIYLGFEIFGLSGQLVGAGQFCTPNAFALRWRTVFATHHIPCSGDAQVLSCAAHNRLLGRSRISIR